MGVAAKSRTPPVKSGWRRWLASGRTRWLGISIAGVFAVALLIPDPGPLSSLRLGIFDSYQTWLPRERLSAPAVIVAVDDASLARIGQWPWPRDTVARLIERVAARNPSAIGVGIMFADPDRTSPERMADGLRARDPALADRLAKLRPNDSILAEAIAGAPVVLGIAGIDQITPDSAPLAPARIVGPPAPLSGYAGALRSLPEIDRAARGHGLLSAVTESGVLRRALLVVTVGERPVLTLTLESLRVAAGESSYTLKFDDDGLTHIAIGEREIPTQDDGSLWIHYTPPDRTRYVSAADVLEGRDAPGLIENKIVLLGATATGLVEMLTTARGERIPGVEIHTQVLENVMDGSLLSRPAWGRQLEALAFALAAILVVFGMPQLPARRSSSIPLQTQGKNDRRRRSRSLPKPSLIVPLVSSIALAATGVSAYFWGHVLLDPATPIAGISALYGLMLSVTLVATDFQRREIAARLATERETAARVAGELEAARSIQTGLLPKPEVVLEHEHRAGIFAYMRPAREVGGDLYDFFLLPGDKLFVMVGDVSGKGLPAAMFMAVSKALAKSSTLRAAASLDTLMTSFNAEISRENPEQLFVTVIALVIDLRTGEVEYCNAGHEPPLLARRSGEIVVVNEGGGPPLCVMDDFPYEQSRIKLEPGDMLVLMSDGITEAMNSDGALCGRDRLNPLLATQGGRGADAAALGNEILAAVKAFEASADPADDQTLVIVSWRGAMGS